MIFSSSVTQIYPVNDYANDLEFFGAARGWVKVAFGPEKEFEYEKAELFEYCQHLLFKADDLDSSVAAQSGSEIVRIADPYSSQAFEFELVDKERYRVFHTETPEPLGFVDKEQIISSILGFCAQTILDYSFHSGKSVEALAARLVPNRWRAEVFSCLEGLSPTSAEKLEPEKIASEGGWMLIG